MRPISSTEILGIWEGGLDQSPVQHGIDLLGLARPEGSPEDLAKLSIGDRDRILLILREQIFGPKLVCLTNCPSCAERLEMTLGVEDILSKPLDSDADMRIGMDGIEVKFRLPNSLDLIAIEENQDMSRARQILVERCIVEVSQNGEKMPSDQLPVKIADAVEDMMEKIDHQSNVNLDLTCPVCGNKWEAAFDIVSFFWSEIDAWAKCVLQEVHVLALAYGWSERDILDMSPFRRQVYLDLVGQ